MCDGIKGRYSLVNQLERSSTSIGANIHEANYAHSKAEIKISAFLFLLCALIKHLFNYDLFGTDHIHITVKVEAA